MLSGRRLLCLVSLLSLTLGLHAQNTFTSVVAFGDSLTDTGNIAHITQSTYLIRYPADNQLLGFDYTSGRFTDGADTQPAAQAYFGVWAEQLAASFPARPPLVDSLDGGTNYAYGEATTQNGTTTISRTFDLVPVSITINNMGQQVASYLATNPTPTAQTLYLVWGGANDLYADSSAASVTATVQRETALIQLLINAGATSFVVPNLPPLGTVPNYAGTSSAAALNTAAQSFAAQLAQSLNALKISAAAQGHIITIYQPDIYTLFANAVASPMSVGLGNVTSDAQNISASPDTYLIWDGLHPTTTGHHFVAAAAANLLTPLVASSTALTIPAAAISSQTVTLKAVVTSTASTAKPTGLVTFFSAGAVIGSAALDTTGTGTATFSASTAGANTITAVYAGDTTFNISTSSAQPLTILPAAIPTATAVVSSSLTANPGASVTFTATVTPSVTTYGTPTGTVNFFEGTNMLGSGTLTNGSATYTTTSLLSGTHVITASFAATGVFAASTSPSISQIIASPNFAASASPTTLTISDGSSGTTTITASATGGYSGTLTLSCGTLPAHLACTFAPASLSLSATTTSQTSTLTILTNASAALSYPPLRPASASRIMVAMLFWPGLGGVLFATLRRRGHPASRLPRLLLFALLLSAGIFTATGCGSNNNAAKGTYTVPVIVTPTTGTAATVQLQVTVQ